MKEKYKEKDRTKCPQEGAFASRKSDSKRSRSTLVMREAES